MLRFAETVLTRRALQDLIRTRHLYDSTSATEEEKVAWMKQQITVTMLPRQHMFTVAFIHSDAHTAQRVTTDLIDLLGNASRTRSVGLHVIDPATLSMDPLRPRFGRFVAAGLLAGLLSGTLVAALLVRNRRQPPAQHDSCGVGVHNGGTSDE
jgi:hypothetical protein